MYEFGIVLKSCGAFEVVYGYNFADACRRARKTPELWEVVYTEYID